MKRTVKTISYVIVSVLLIVLLLNLFIYKNDEQASTVAVWDPSTLSSVTSEGYVVGANENYVQYVQKEGDPKIYLSPSNVTYNTIIVEFAKPVETTVTTRVYYTPNGAFSEAEAVNGTLSADGMKLAFVLPAVEDATHLRLDIDGDFALQKVTLQYLNSVRTMNRMSVCGIILMFALLLLVERKFGYFSWIAAPIRRKLIYLKELIQNEKYFSACLRLIADFSALAVLFGIGALITLGYYSKITISLALLATALAIALQLWTRISSGNGAEPSKLFLVVALLGGALMCYALPPCLFVSWDDEIHFSRIYNAVHLFNNETSVSYLRMIVHLMIPVETYAQDPMAFIYSMVQGGNLIFAYNPTFLSPYTLIGYSPMIFVTAILSLLGSDIVKIIVLSRLASMVAYVLIIYLAIRKLKSGAHLFSAIALLPCMIFMASSIGYDYWVMAWLGYAFASLIAGFQDADHKFSAGDITKILLAFFIGCGPKAIYACMLLPLLFLKTDKFETPALAKKFRVWTAITFGVIVMTIILPVFFSADAYSDLRGGSDVNSGEQVKFILSNPIQYTKILLRFLGEQYLTFPTLSQWGVFYAYLGHPSIFYGTIATFLIMYCTFTDRKADDGYESFKGFRWLVLLACFVQICLIATSLYVGFTPVGLETINGCQYRYVFPLLIPFCFFIVPGKIKCEISEKVQSTIVYSGLSIALLGSLFSVFVSKL